MLRLVRSGSCFKQLLQGSKVGFVGTCTIGTDHLALDVRYFDTDEHDFGAAYDGRVAASLKATF